MASTSSLTQRAYDHLHRSIAGGELRPGAVLSEASLAKKLGISRTPIGEAIRQLVSEGLIEQVPRVGTIVRHIDHREIRELYEMRVALESYAAGQAAAKITNDALVQLERFCGVMGRLCEEVGAREIPELDEAMLRRFLAADMAFHMLILEAADNRRMLKVVKDMRTISRIFRLRRARHDLKVIRRAHEFHCRILQALRSGDAESARQAMAEHILASKKETLEAFERESPSGAGAVLKELPPDVLHELDQIEQSAEGGAGE